MGSSVLSLSSRRLLSCALALSSSLFGCAELLGVSDFDDATTNGSVGGTGPGGAGGQAGGGATGGEGARGGSGGIGPSQPQLAWIGQLRGTGNDNVQGVAFDGSGRLAVCGRFAGSLAYDLDGTVGTSRTSAGGYDIFVLKVGTSGSEQWLQQFGNANDQGCMGTAFVGQSETLITGYTVGFTDFGAYPLDGGVQKTAYLTRLRDDGNVVGATQFDAGGEQEPWDLHVAPNNQRWFVGQFTGSASFGGAPIETGASTPAGFAAYTSGPNGRLVAGVGADGATDGEAQHAYSVHSASASRVLVGGRNEGTITAPTTSALAVHAPDPFVAEFDESATMTRVIGFKSSGVAQTQAVAGDADGSVVAVGFFTTDLTVVDQELTGFLGWDLFVAKLAPDWSTATVAVGLGLGGDQEGRDVALDSAGNIYVAVNFTGPIEIEGETISPTGPQSGLLLALDGNGTHRFHVSFLSSDLVFLSRIAVDSLGSKVAVGGHFRNELTMALNGTPVGPALTSESAYDGLIAVFDLPPVR